MLQRQIEWRSAVRWEKLVESFALLRSAVPKVTGRLVDVKMIPSLRRLQKRGVPSASPSWRQILEYRRYSASLQGVPDGFTCESHLKWRSSRKWSGPFRPENSNRNADFGTAGEIYGRAQQDLSRMWPILQLRRRIAGPPSNHSRVGYQSNRERRSARYRRRRRRTGCMT